MEGLSASEIGQIARLAMPEVVLNLSHRSAGHGVLLLEFDGYTVACVNWMIAPCINRGPDDRGWYADYHYMAPYYKDTPEYALVGERWVEPVGMTVEAFRAQTFPYRQQAVNFILKDPAVQARMIRLSS